MYGLSTGGPTRNIRQSISFRDDFSKIMGTHAFKMGYEILHFEDNYWQLGQPSGVFQFDNMTAGLQPSGNPVPATGNTFAAFLLGSVRQGKFSPDNNNLAPPAPIHNLCFPNSLQVFANPALHL